jgi:hypothetical protein
MFSLKGGGELWPQLLQGVQAVSQVSLGFVRSLHF